MWGGLPLVDIMTEPVIGAGQSGWHMVTAKPVTQIEATIYDSVSERRLVPASGTHTARDNIYSDPHAL